MLFTVQPYCKIMIHNDFYIEMNVAMSLNRDYFDLVHFINRPTHT